MLKIWFHGTTQTGVTRSIQKRQKPKCEEDPKNITSKKWLPPQSVSSFIVIRYYFRLFPSLSKFNCATRGVEARRDRLRQREARGEGVL